MDHRIDVTAIEAALDGAGISVAAFCRTAEIEQSTWQRLKNGDSQRPRRKTARAVAAALASLGLSPAQPDESSAETAPTGHVHSPSSQPNPPHPGAAE